MKKNKHSMTDIQNLHRAGNLDEARAGYLALLRDNPTDAEALHALGILCAQQSDFDTAVTYLQKAAQHQPHNPTILVNLANALKAAGVFSQAAEVLHAAIELDPEYDAALNNLGTVYYAQGKLTEAIKYYRLALEKQPNFSDAHYNLGLAYTKQNQSENAIAAYKTLLDTDPENTATCFQLGCLLLQQEQVAEALKYFLLVELRHPKHVETQTNLATSYLKQGALNQAKIHYLNALALTPGDSQILFNIGVINMQQGHIDSAIQHYQRALQIDPDNFAVHNNLGVAFLAKQHTGFALRHFREALRLQPNNEAIQYTVQMLAQDQRLLASPPEYIKNLFDSYADHYDLHLRTGLDYQIPEFLLAAVKKVIKNSASRLDILDLGCGTGLCGTTFKPLAKSLTGVDLSPKMLEVAATKNIYDALITDNLQTFLAQKQATYDLIIAGDVLVYLGDLKILFADTRHALREQGLLAFNTEITDQVDYVMSQSGRFAHNQSYLDQLAKQHNFKIMAYQKIILRLQNNEPIYGHLYLLQAQ
jgi:predicted TPR repeat methyltransferase